MGLQSQLNDVGSDSIPILLLALLATAVTHLRSLLSSLSHLHSHHPHHHHISAVAEHLSTNHHLTSRYSSSDGSSSDDCVFCLCHLRHGDRVRRLHCRHVFHKDCLDGWIDQMKFLCPLCRSPLDPSPSPPHVSVR